MCGIYAAINNNSVTDHLLSGLSALTYRGYDSAGIAIVNKGRIERRRAEGKLDALSGLLHASPLDGNIGIAHTRWATHGLPTEANAHPHMTPRVALAHNGIVENYDKLRKKLEESGYLFESETDSETIAQLITYFLDLGLEPENALCSALTEIKGSFGIVVIFSERADELFAARKGSPLVLGRGDDGFYISSDLNAFSGHVNAVTHLKDGDIVKVTQETFDVFNLEGQKLHRLLQHLEHDNFTSSKHGYPHFMLKEIYEQPDVFERTWRHYFNNSERCFQLPRLPFDPETLERISLIACGTSYFAGMVGKHWLEQHANIAVDLDIASEYRYRNAPIAKNSASFFISQSGETADTLAALDYAKSHGQACAALVNVLTSTMANEASAVFPTLAGPEIGVASTKAFTSQLTSLLILTLALAKARGRQIQEDDYLVDQMVRFPDQMRAFLSDIAPLNKIAERIKDARNMLYLGRGIAYPLAEEGALKLKEISYIHAEAYPAGELKHGPLALVDEHMPVVVIAPPDPLFDKTLSNLREVASRKGKIILISDRNGIAAAGEHATYHIEMPPCDAMLAPIFYTLPLQMLAYQIAVLRGNDVDQPRNLAKSVTVE